MRAFKFILVIALMFATGTELLAQRGPGRRRHRRADVVVVHRSAYRPAKVVVYHPAWRPAYTYHRRWVFFPRYNIYWDNWRNHYVYWNGSVWISQPTAPPVVVNVNLANEKSVELNENDDDVDDIYQSNNSHKSSYPQ